MPTSIDLFDPMALPDSAGRGGGSSHRAARSSSQRQHHSKKKVAFAIQSLSPTRKVVKNMLLQKHRHWLRQILQAWSLFAQSQQLKRLKQKERKILAALRHSQQQHQVTMMRPSKRSKSSKKKRHRKKSHRAARGGGNVFAEAGNTETT